MNNNNSFENNKSDSEKLTDDLNESLKTTIDEVKSILETLETTLEKTIDDQSTSDDTKNTIRSINDQIKNITLGESKKIIKMLNPLKEIDNFEEE